MSDNRGIFNHLEFRIKLKNKKTWENCWEILKNIFTREILKNVFFVVNAVYNKHISKKIFIIDLWIIFNYRFLAHFRVEWAAFAVRIERIRTSILWIMLDSQKLAATSLFHASCKDGFDYFYSHSSGIVQFISSWCSRQGNSLEEL